MLPTFKNQPDEANELMPKVVSLLKKNKYEVYTNSLFDILVLNEGSKKDKHIELKVRLSSQHNNSPITANQWQLVKDIAEKSILNKNARVLIYDSQKNKYGIFTLFEIKKHIQVKEPKSTSYIKKLNTLQWHDPKTAWKILVEWITK